jgi:hypothetical protein
MESRTSSSTHVNPQDVSSDDTPSPPGLNLGPNPEDIESARALRAEAISTLDLFFSQIEAPSPQHLMEVRGVVSTLLDGLLEHQAAMVSLIQMRRFPLHTSNC